MITVERLKQLGMDGAAEKINKTAELKRKLMIAYEHFRVVTPGILDRFQEELKNKTYSKETWSYDRLRLTNLKEYKKVPPEDVLVKIEEAQRFRCFDYYEVADIETVVERPDPIVFGRVNGSPDLFFVAQWDDDVKIDDILRENEG